MARPRIQTAEPPSWFDLAQYAEAEGMDAADWYLNLRLRVPDTRGAKLAKALCESKQPLLRREQIASKAQAAIAMAVQGLPGACQAILRGQVPEPSVYPMSVSAFYWFEHRFPEEVREFAKDLRFPVPPSANAPEAFHRPVDDVHGPDPSKQMLARFARIDLSRPDKELREDFDRYLAQQRKKLAEIPGDHPYREALDDLETRKELKFPSLVNYGLLPFLDLERWSAETGATVTNQWFGDLLQIDPKDGLRETRRYAELLQDDFVLSGWLLPLACNVMRGPPRD